ncbi:hypothetical protein [Peptoniphilus catoniae]|uniref:hypothetical protein n=1 Tax=Peptoniphilus catoniae TaxID=1660341 RepID=UPI0010FD6C32|nr:hypothetical protein [Peptoniphilus catoniae]
MSEERVMQIVNFNADIKRIQENNRRIKELRLSKYGRVDKEKERLYTAIFFLMITVYLMAIVLMKMAIK